MVVENDAGQSGIFLQTILEAILAEDEAVVELPGYDVDR
jgi:hypothetical protein